MEVTEHAQRRSTQVLLEHMDMMSRLGVLTSQLLATREAERIPAIIAEHLPGLGTDDSAGLPLRLR